MNEVAIKSFSRPHVLFPDHLPKKEVSDMPNSMSTFKRYEKKYLINIDQYHSFLSDIDDFIVKDKFPSYTIGNIYYDTESYEIIRRSIDKPLFKEKLRARSYGWKNAKKMVFFELKKKFKKEVFKRRVKMPLADLENYLNNGVIPDVYRQVIDEIEYFMNMYKPVPKIFIAYEREAYAGKEDGEIRITFDSNIRYRVNDLSLSLGDYGNHILDPNQRLAEIKVRGAMPLWLSNALTKNEMYSTSFSKYGYCFQNYIAEEVFTAA
ncbi:MAG TPA: polyphosphate polymerase domain-containing protein [Caldisericia bacterium]|nr:polyphosphate polymerase domain-containing protein [Caldisericia bacterium]HPF48953.1 polyphosphate polymerase domain-containing protein [Caldisericia bacterium]HPI83183.1 polyphosphate polymerase domain-containing protein [Caldisericia bacterium]HPQ92410.1 polyphosphate polymerase domain-containing protein [Caldisericia bacterium]HRV74492.1 polyphosphate polymerase domain-containing protein [Caldisericia bacterium]